MINICFKKIKKKKGNKLSNKKTESKETERITIAEIRKKKK